jgi:O-methyltransferase
MISKFFKKINRSPVVTERLNPLMFSDFTAYENEICDFVQPFTMTSKERIITLIRAVNFVLDNNIKGDFVECGVWKGGSSMAIARILKDRGVIDRTLYLYDTFDGMVPPGELDRQFDGKSAASLLNTQMKEDSIVWAYSPEAEVMSNLSNIGLSPTQIKLIKGDVCETLLQDVPNVISLLRLDTDWYESTRAEMEILFPRVAAGGFIIVDDYGHWEGCKKAVDEYLQQIGIPYFMNRIDYTGRLIIKQ